MVRSLKGSASHGLDMPSETCCSCRRPCCYDSACGRQARVLPVRRSHILSLHEVNPQVTHALLWKGRRAVSPEISQISAAGVHFAEVTVELFFRVSASDTAWEASCEGRGEYQTKRCICTRSAILPGSGLRIRKRFQGPCLLDEPCMPPPASV